MNELTALLDDRDKLMLGNELEKLFVFQDRPFSKEKKVLFIEELSLSGLPLPALLQGIRKLAAEDLKTIKLATIKEAANDCIVNSEEDTSKCDHCGHGGLVCMKDPEARMYALACKCRNGDRLVSAQKLARWDGHETMFRNDRLLTLAAKI